LVEPPHAVRHAMKAAANSKASGEKNSTKVFRDRQGIWDRHSLCSSMNLFWLKIIKNYKFIEFECQLTILVSSISRLSRQ